MRRKRYEKALRLDGCPGDAVGKSIDRHRVKRDNLVEAFRHKMERTEIGKNCKVHFSHVIEFRDGVRENGNFLVLESPMGRPVSYLGYDMGMANGKGVVKIDFIQTGPADPRKAKQELGIHPHEKILETFLIRLKPFIRKFNPKITLPRIEWGGHEQIYKPLRDRYFTKDGKLNPRKKRVQAILGNLVNQIR